MTMTTCGSRRIEGPGCDYHHDGLSGGLPARGCGHPEVLLAVGGEHPEFRLIGGNETTPPSWCPLEREQRKAARWDVLANKLQPLMVESYIALHEIEGEEAAVVTDVLHKLARAVQDHDLEGLEIGIPDRARARLQELELHDGRIIYLDPAAIVAIHPQSSVPHMTTGVRVVFRGGADLVIDAPIADVLKLVRGEAPKP